MKDFASQSAGGFSLTRRELLGFGLAFAGAAAINLVPGLNPVASAQAAVP